GELRGWFEGNFPSVETGWKLGHPRVHRACAGGTGRRVSLLHQDRAAQDRRVDLRRCPCLRLPAEIGRAILPPGGTRVGTKESGLWPGALSTDDTCFRCAASRRPPVEAPTA